VAAWREKLDNPARKMMSPTQEAWLAREMTASVKSAIPWQVLGNQVVMARLFTPPVRRYMTPEAYAQVRAELPRPALTRLRKLEQNAALGLPWGADMWDGYPADRQRLYAIAEKAKANLVVVSGDSHAFWTNELWTAETGGRRVGVEFGTAGITSPGPGEAYPQVPLGDAFAKYNREVLYNNQTAKGFVLLTLTQTTATGELVSVSSIKERGYSTRVLATYRVVTSAGGISAPRPVQA
jgi:alkaline phosphatase D